MKSACTKIGLMLGIFSLCAINSFALGAEITLKLGHVAPPGPSTHDVSANKFAARVAANTNGKIEIKVFGNSQFGTMPEHWAQLKGGAIDLFVEDSSAAFMVEPEPKNLMIALYPYVFRSQEQVHTFYDSQLLKSMMGKIEKAAGIKYLGYIGDRSPRGFSTTSRKVTSVEEIKGLKLRVPPVPPFVAAYTSWGANPTPVHGKDLYTSIKSGMVDGCDYEITNMHATKFYEIQKYFTAINYVRSGMGCWINQKKWDSFPNDIKEALLKSAQETEIYVNQFTSEQVAKIEKSLTEMGMEIIHPDLKSWIDLAKAEVLKNDGKVWEKGLYKKVQALLKNN